jgi:uncharacterized alpha-E superfamily protein
MNAEASKTLPLALLCGGDPTDRSATPEQRLMLAVLDDAFATVLRNVGASSRGRRLLDETARWFAADDDASPFSFVNVCHALRLDASQVRGRLAVRRRERLARLPTLRASRPASALPRFRPFPRKLAARFAVR